MLDMIRSMYDCVKSREKYQNMLSEDLTCLQGVKNNISMCGLSEHWLLDYNAHLLGNIDKDYPCIVLCSAPAYGAT